MFQIIIRKECSNGNRTDKQLVQKVLQDTTICGLCSIDLIYFSAQSRMFAQINDTSDFRKQSALKVILKTLNYQGYTVSSFAGGGGGRILCTLST